MKKYIQTIVILLVVTLFFSCESDPLLEDFETTNNTLNIESIEGAEATSNNKAEDTNADVEEDDLPPSDVEEDDLPPSGKTNSDNVEEDDLPPTAKTNNDSVEEDDLPPAEIKSKKKVEEDDLPPSGN